MQTIRIIAIAVIFIMSIAAVKTVLPNKKAHRIFKNYIVAFLKTYVEDNSEASVSSRSFPTFPQQG